MNEIELKRKAIRFARTLRDEGIPSKIPEDWWETMTDDEIRTIREILPTLGVVQREKDALWEHARHTR